MRWPRLFVLSCLALLGLLFPAAAEDVNMPANLKPVCDAYERLAKPDPSSAGPVADDCVATDLYDGVGKPADYKAARACALKVLADPTLKGEDRDAAGSNFGVLSMVYANGLGVPRNDDLAIAYACKQSGAPAEIRGHIAMLMQRREQGASAEKYDYCDDITSGLMEGFCARRLSAKMEAERNAKIAGLVSGLKGKARQKFERLKQAHATYTQAIGDNEVDMTGTARGALFIEATDAEKDRFSNLLEWWVATPAEKPAQPDFRQSDAELNSRYQAVMSIKDFDGGTVTQDGIRQTQREWLVYRDAFVAFSGEASDGRLAATLTADRSDMFKRFLPQSD